MAKSYVVEYERGESGWVATIKGVKGVRAQGRSIREARARLRVALVAALGEAAAGATQRDEIGISGALKKAVLAVKSAQEKAEREQTHAAELARKVARELVRVGKLSVRDAGEVLGVSGARVQQLIHD